MRGTTPVPRFFMDRPYLIDKPLGATPLQALELLRALRNITPSEKLAYAGRLDPMASGLLAILYGGQLSRQEEYWHLPKQYEAEVVFGISTDSYDLLGLPTTASLRGPVPERITPVIQGMVGKIDISVPMYSSQRYEGRALFALAREGRDNLVVVPVRRMSINQIDVKEVGSVALDVFASRALERISVVRGDFRQKDISDAWHRFAGDGSQLTMVRLDIHCASGTYIRSLAYEIGRRLGTGAVLSSLRRTRIGSWRITDADVTRLSWPQ